MRQPWLVQYINNVSKTVISQERSDIMPCVNDHVVIAGKEYIVTGRLFNHAVNIIWIFVRNVSSNDITYMK